MTWLYRYEAKGIQGYILGSDKLVEMKGASEIVEALGGLTEQRLTELGVHPSKAVLMLAAGGGTLIFETDEQLRGFAEDWVERVHKHAPGLLAVQAWERRANEGDHQRALEALLAKLEAERNRPNVSLPEVGPFVARASRTGRPAVVRRDGVLRDASTHAKVEGEDRSRMEEIFELPQGERFATDLDRYGEGYLAVVHADGNGVGKRIVEQVSKRAPHDQQKFSVELTLATRAAARKAWERVHDGVRQGASRGRGGFLELPFRPLVVGGDDLTLILRGCDAFRFTRAYLDAFAEETRSREAVGSLTAAAGICLFRSGHPFFAAHAIAEALCKTAKTVASDGPNKPSALALFRVTSAHAESLEDLRRDELEFDRGASDGAEGHQMLVNPDLRLRGSLEAPPWTRERLKHLDQLRAQLRHVPKGAVREWLRLVRLDVGRASAHWGRVLEVMRTGPATQRAALTAMDEALRRLGCGGADKPLDTDFRTPLLDAVTWNAIDGGP